MSEPSDKGQYRDTVPIKIMKSATYVHEQFTVITMFFFMYETGASVIEKLSHNFSF